MGRKIFIVAVDQAEMYESLRRALAGEDDVAVVYDRRVANRKRDTRNAGSIWSRGPLAAVGDRRTPSHVEDDLRQRGWAVVRMDDR